MMRTTLLRRWVLLLSLCALNSIGAEAPTPPPVFSSLKPGDAVAERFRLITLPRVKANVFSLVDDEGKTVLEVRSEASAATVAIPLTAAAPARVAWRWKIDHVIANADMGQKSGDDFAARFYVFFDAPMDRLTFFERTKIRLVRLIWGEDVPTAALCYVWDNKHPVGYAQASPYTRLVRVMVLQSGQENAGKWQNESRDLEADFKSQFGYDMPAITGVAVGSDTDQTGESARTWFGDVTLKSTK